MKKKGKKYFVVFLLGAIFVFFGCAHNLSTDVIQLQDQVKQKDKDIKVLESNNKNKDEAIEQYKKDLEKQSRLTSDAEKRAKAPVEAPLLPSNAKAGECYARVYAPPTYKTINERRLKRAASERLEIIPAKYEWVEEKVLVKQSSQRLETIPAKYDWVEEKVLVKQASQRLETIPAEYGLDEEKVLVKEASFRMEDVPAKYDWVEEKVLVKPAATVWKKGSGLIEKIDNTTGELMCLVEIPPVYKTVKKTVMVTPPTTRKIEIPAEYKTVKRKVVLKPPATRTIEIPAEYKTLKKKIMVKPPTTRPIEIPAEYKIVKVRKLVTPPQEKRIAIPEEHQTITRTEQVADGRMEWKRVLCKTNMTPDMVARIQTALLKADNDPGPIDGIIGWKTNSAIKAYQKTKGLAVGSLTYETIKSLGIEL
jgi:hypothetical protein